MTCALCGDQQGERSEFCDRCGALWAFVRGMTAMAALPPRHVPGDKERGIAPNVLRPVVLVQVDASHEARLISASVGYFDGKAVATVITSGAPAALDTVRRIMTEPLPWRVEWMVG